MSIFDIDPKEIRDDYEEVWPWEQEYQAWVNAIESDVMEEFQHRAAISTQEDRDHFRYD